MTFVVQAVRILAIWAAARAVGIDLDPRIYYVFGPLLFLVMLVPFTLNGLLCARRSSSASSGASGSMPIRPSPPASCTSS